MSDSGDQRRAGLTQQVRLGHASAVETLETYSRLWPDPTIAPAKPSTPFLVLRRPTMWRRADSDSENLSDCYPSESAPLQVRGVVRTGWLMGRGVTPREWPPLEE